MNKWASHLLFGEPIYSGQDSRRSVALTFDDGPSDGTPAILDLLSSAGISATFFQCGMNVQRHPSIARLVASDGHEIGNHTFSHPRLCPRIGWKWNLHGPSFVEKEFALAQRIIEEEAGVRPVLMRAPYGLPWFGMRKAQRKLGLRSTLWTVIGMDWAHSSSAVIDIVMRGVAPGGIVCLHDGRDTRNSPDITATVNAVREMIPRLKDEGYSFETASSILQS